MKKYILVLVIVGGVAIAAGSTGGALALRLARSTGRAPWSDDGSSRREAQVRVRRSHRESLETIETILEEMSAQLADLQRTVEWLEEHPTPLHSAARAGDVRTVKTLIDDGADVHPRTLGARWTPLYVAAASGHADVVKALLDAGAAPNAADFRGRTALHEAAANGNLKIMEMLIHEGADVNASENLSGITPLDLAMMGRHVEAAIILCPNGADARDLQLPAHSQLRTMLVQNPRLKKALREAGAFEQELGAHGMAAIHQVLEQRGDDERTQSMLAYFLDTGADVNIPTSDGRTLLHMAAQQGRLKIVKFLLERAADPNRRDNQRYTALDYAAEQGWAEVVEVLDPVTDGSIALDALVAGGFIERLRNRLAEDPEARKRVANDRECFMRAVHRGNVEMVKLMSSIGVPVTEVESVHGKPLMYACMYDHVELARYLIEEGAHVNEVATGTSCLGEAVWNRSYGVLRLLLEHGAEPNTGEGEGYPPLHLAVGLGEKKSIRILLEGCARPLWKDPDGKTALQHTTDEAVLEILRDYKRPNSRQSR